MQSFIHASALCFSREKVNVAKVLKDFRGGGEISELFFSNRFPCLNHHFTCDQTSQFEIIRQTSLVSDTSMFCFEPDKLFFQQGQY